MIWKVYFCVNNSVVLMYRKRLYGKATGQSGPAKDFRSLYFESVVIRISYFPLLIIDYCTIVQYCVNKLCCISLNFRLYRWSQKYSQQEQYESVSIGTDAKEFSVRFESDWSFLPSGLEFSSESTGILFGGNFSLPHYWF